MSDKEPFLVIRYNGQSSPEVEGPKSMTLVYAGFTDPKTGKTLHKEVRYAFGYDGVIRESIGFYPEPRIKHGLSAEEQDDFAYSEDKGNAVSARRVSLAEVQAATKDVKNIFTDTRHFPFDPQNPNDRQQSWLFTQMEYGAAKEKIDWARLEKHSYKEPEIADVPAKLLNISPPVPISAPLPQPPKDYIGMYTQLVKDSKYKPLRDKILEMCSSSDKAVYLDEKTMIGFFTKVLRKPPFSLSAAEAEILGAAVQENESLHYLRISSKSPNTYNRTISANEKEALNALIAKTVEIAPLLGTKGNAPVWQDIQNMGTGSNIERMIVDAITEPSAEALVQSPVEAHVNVRIAKKVCVEKAAKNYIRRHKGHESDSDVKNVLTGLAAIEEGLEQTLALYQSAHKKTPKPKGRTD